MWFPLFGDGHGVPLALSAFSCQEQPYHHQGPPQRGSWECFARPFQA